MKGLKSACLALVAFVTVIPISSLAQEAQGEWHPALKEFWQDQDDWEVMTPADVNLDAERLIGLRALYHREEDLLRNPLVEEAGFQFERGWLRGEPILIGRYFTSGDPDRDDSGPSYWTQMLEPTSMRTLGMISASIRWGSFAKRVSDAGTTTTTWSMGNDESAWSEPTVIAEHQPVVELSVWAQALAGLPLKEGLKFRLQSQATWIGPFFHVAGRTTFQDTQGKPHEVWQIETNMGRRGWLGISYVSTEAPVLIGFEMKHVESGDVNIRWRLKSYRWLE